MLHQSFKGAILAARFFAAAAITVTALISPLSTAHGATPARMVANYEACVDREITAIVADALASTWPDKRDTMNRTIHETLASKCRAAIVSSLPQMEGIKIARYQTGSVDAELHKQLEASRSKSREIEARNAAAAQTKNQNLTAPTPNCTALTDPTKRLACYDRTAGVQARASKATDFPAPEAPSAREADSAAAASKGISSEIYRWAKQYEALVHAMCQNTVVEHSPYGGKINWISDYRWDAMVIGKGRITISGRDIQLKNRYGTEENVIYDCYADLKSLPKTSHGGAIEGYEPKASDGERTDDWAIDPDDISAHPPWFLNQNIDLQAPDFKLQMQWGGVY